MRLNSNIQWIEFEGKGYFKINGRIIEVYDFDVQDQEKYWNMILENKDDLFLLQQIFEEDNEFNKFFGFIRMLGGFYDPVNNWTCFEKKYRMDVHNLDKKIQSFKLSILGEEDLIKIAAEMLKKTFTYTDSNEDFAIIIGRKDNLLSLLRYNRRLVNKGVPFLTILLEPFSLFVGPLTVPHMTPCLNCISRNYIGNQLGTKEIFRKLYSAFPDISETIPEATLGIAVKIVEMQIIKYLIRMEKNQNSLRVSNSILEYDIFNDQVEWHPVLKDIRCSECQNTGNIAKSEKWLNVGDENGN